MTQAEKFLNLGNNVAYGLSEAEEKRIEAKFNAVAALAKTTYLETGDEKGGRDLRFTFPDGSFLDVLARSSIGLTSGLAIRLADGTVLEQHATRY
jgi:hypothetical protein